MCLVYLECMNCGDRIQCSANCYCVDDDECHESGHRDCKSFDRCNSCEGDICEQCYLDLKSNACKKCK